MEVPRRPVHRSAPVAPLALLIAAVLAALGIAAAGSAAGLIRTPGPDRAGPRAALPAPPAAPAAAGVGAGPVAPRRAAAPSPQDTTRRFDHAAHAAVACTSCHGAGDRHRTVSMTVTRECAACHHDPSRRQACTSCHAAGSLPEPGTVTRDVALGVWSGPRPRDLPFGHARHGAVACRECHGAPVTLAMDRACGTCHEAHHGRAAECGACHSPAAVPVHTAAVHLGCAGGGCHDAARLPAAPFARATCVACHPARRDHEPGGDCAACHLLRPAGSP